MEDNAFILGVLTKIDSALAHDFAAKGRRQEFPAGEHIIHQGEPSKTLYFMDRGMIESSTLKDDGRKKIYFINAGSCLVGLPWEDSEPSPVSCCCLTDSSFFAVEKSQLKDFSVDMLLELFNYSVYETILLQNQLRSLTTLSSKDNIMLILREYEQLSSAGRVGGFKLTQQIIADMVGITRTQVSNILPDIFVSDSFISKG